MYPWFQSDPLTLLQHSLHTQSLARDIIRGIYVRASHKLRTTRFFWDDRLGNVDRKLLSHREEFNRQWLQPEICSWRLQCICTIDVMKHT